MKYLKGVKMLVKAKTFILSVLGLLSLATVHNTCANDQHYFEIFDAINNKDENIALELLEAYHNTISENPNRPIPGSEELDRRTLLHFAAERNRPQVIRRLIALGANRNLSDSSGITPVDLAGENREILEALGHINQPATISFQQLRQRAQQAIQSQGWSSYVPSWLRVGGSN